MTHGKGNVVPASGSFSPTFYSYGGNPNGVIVAANKGDFCVDYGTPAIWQATAIGDSNWITANAGGSIQLLDFPFAYDTPNLSNGAPLYVPKPGDILYNAWIEVTTPWDGDTPQADIGLWSTLADTPSGFVNGFISSSESQPLIDMTRADSDPATNGMLMNFGQWGSLDANVAVAHIRSLPAKFLTDTPVSVVVSQTGTSGGLDVGASQGAAILHLVIGNSNSVTGGGTVPGYRQIPFTYNGSAQFVADCLVGEEFDPTVGGWIFGAFPVEPFFGTGPFPKNFTCTAYIDSNSVIQNFMYQIIITDNQNSQFSSFGNDGTLNNIDIQNPILTSYNQNMELTSNSGISIVDNSNAGIDIHENGNGDIQIHNESNSNGTFIVNHGGNFELTNVSNAPFYIENNGGGDLALSTNNGGSITLQTNPGPNINVLTADRATNLSSTPTAPAFGYTTLDQNPTGWGNVNNSSSIFVWNTTHNQWQPIPQNVGVVQLYPNGNGITFLDGALELYVSPYYSGQPVGLVSNAAPSAFGLSQFATFTPESNFAVFVNPQLTLLATGSDAVGGWDYVDLDGSITVTDGTTANFITCTFNRNHLRSDTAPFNPTLTQTGLGGGDLSTDGTSIYSTAGGTYNVSMYARATWD